MDVLHNFLIYIHVHQIRSLGRDLSSQCGEQTHALCYSHKEGVSDNLKRDLDLLGFRILIFGTGMGKILLSLSVQSVIKPLAGTG